MPIERPHWIPSCGNDQLHIDRLWPNATTTGSKYSPKRGHFQNGDILGHSTFPPFAVGLGDEAWIRDPVGARFARAIYRHRRVCPEGSIGGPQLSYYS
jgi:hypothetical protein